MLMCNCSLVCNCSLEGTSACYTCGRYLEEIRKYGSMTFTGPNITTTPSIHTYVCVPDNTIIDRYKEKLQTAIKYFEQDVKEWAVSKDYIDAHDSNIKLKTYKECLRMLAEVEGEK